MASRTHAHGTAPRARSMAPDVRRRRLPMRWLLPSLLLVAMLAMLMLRGYVHSEILADHQLIQPEAATDKVPDGVADGGPGHRHPRWPHEQPDRPRPPAGSHLRRRPPAWTPKVLDVLKKHYAHAVFFVTGTMTSRYPELVKRMVEEGHEVGLHTFNHPDLSFQSTKRIDWELSQNQLALTGAAGIRTSLFRPPYSSFADAMGQQVLAGDGVHRYARLHHRRQQHRQ